MRASFGAQLQHMVLTVLALWIPLLPLLFLAQRLVESRSGNKRRKPGGTNAPRITFADVAGELLGSGCIHWGSSGGCRWRQCCQLVHACMRAAPMRARLHAAHVLALKLLHAHARDTPRAAAAT